MTNGFPRLSMHDLKDVYRLGMLARRWADTPLALSPQELEEYQTLCDRYELRAVEVLMEFQKMTYAPDLLRPMPTVSGGSGPRPSPHPRPEGDNAQQPGSEGWIGDGTAHVPFPEAFQTRDNYPTDMDAGMEQGR